MVVKNIVNIQENKISYDIGSTSSLNFSFGNQEYFTLSESTNNIDTERHFQFIATKTCSRDDNVVADSTNVDFVGRISNIDNHYIRDLNDVSDSTDFTTNPNGGSGYALLYDADTTNWIPAQIITTLKMSGVSSGDSELDINLLTDIFRIIGSENKITTQVNDTDNSVTISLPTSVIIDNTLTVGPTNVSPLCQAVITTDDTTAIFKNYTGDGAITIGTSGTVTIGSGNFIVNSNTTLNGNLTVHGTQTIINTEQKLIGDSLIELGYSDTNSLSDRDIGFFGQYDSSNYAGLYYDVSDEAFKVFDVLGTNDYETSLGTNTRVLSTNTRAANIEAKKFITDKGDFGEVIVEETVNSTTPNKNLKDMLIEVYGLEKSGLFSGKALIYLYNRDDASHAFSTVLNYNFHLVQNLSPGATDGGLGTVLKTVVELETKATGATNYLINFSSSDNSISLTNLSPLPATYTLVVKILPILSYRNPNLVPAPTGEGGVAGATGAAPVT